MAQVTYSFEGGTNGNTVAAGAGAAAGDTNFDTVTNASATDIYDNTRAAHGTLSNKIATAATSTTCFNAWTTAIGTQTTVWVRAYLFFTAAPAVQHRVVNFVGSAASRGNVLATTGGALIFTNAAGGTVLTSAAFPLNSWFRLEAMFTGSATVGQWEYKIWNSPDSTGTPDDTQTSAANLATGGTCDAYRFGIGTAVANAGPFWMDDVGVSTAAYLGPAVTAAPAGAGIARPGQTWQRRFRHRQLPPQPAAVAAALNGTVQGRATAGVPRRLASRAVVRGNAVPAVPSQPVPGTAPDHLVVARRAASRGVWRGTTVVTVNAVPSQPVPGTAPDYLVVARRAAARGVWRGVTARTVNAQPQGQVQPRATVRVPRRYPSRGWFGANAAQANAAAPSPGAGFTQDHLVVARRYPSRAVWRGFVSETTNLLNGNDPGGLVRRRAAARAVWYGVTARTVNAVPPVSGTAPDHLTVSRRQAARAVWHGTAPVTVNAVPGTAPDHLVVARRYPPRAVWRGTAAVTVNATPPVAGTAPDHVVVARRAASRAVWRGTTSVTVNAVPAQPVNGTAPDHLTVARRQAARGFWRGTTAVTVNAVPSQPVPGTAPDHLVIARRGTARAVWHGGPVPPASPVPVTADHLVVARRQSARAVWYGVTVRTVNAQPPSGTVPDHLVIARRQAARGFWRGNAAPARTRPPATGGLVRRRRAARGRWAGYVSVTVNAPPLAHIKGYSRDTSVTAAYASQPAVTGIPGQATAGAGAGSQATVTGLPGGATVTPAAGSQEDIS